MRLRVCIQVLPFNLVDYIILPTNPMMILKKKRKLMRYMAIFQSVKWIQGIISEPSGAKMILFMELIWGCWCLSRLGRGKGDVVHNYYEALKKM